MADHATSSSSSSSPSTNSACCLFPPNLPWLIKLQVRIVHSYLSFTLRSKTTLNRTMANFCNLRTPPNPTNPINGLTTRDISIPNNLTFRLFTPSFNKPNHKIPLIIYFHGGEFIFQTADSSGCHAIAATLSLQLPAAVVSLSYRLAPEHKYPSQHQDAHNMIAFLDANPHLLPPSADLSNTFLLGDSAGANLAHFAAAQFSSPSKSALHSITLRGLVSIQPFFGGEERTDSELRLFHGPMIPVSVADWMWRAYLPQGADRDHEACNVTNAEMELEGFPRSLVVVGGYDPLKDWQRRYCEWLRRCGKEVEVLEFENAMHGFYTFPELDDTKMLYEQVSKFVHSLQVDVSRSTDVENM